MPSYKKAIIGLLAAFCVTTIHAQAEKSPLIIELTYHLKNNQYPFLFVHTKTKVEKQFPPVPNVEVSVYINEEADAMLLGKVKTDASGNALLTIGSAFKPLWDSSTKFIFLASSPGNAKYEASTAEINITKAKIFIDTLADAETRTLSASVIEQLNGTTVAAKDVELKIIVSRMAGNLSVGEAETYTTDSTGVALAEFKRDSIPGDLKGFITVIAKTEDNDTYGNISIEKQVKWGAPFVPDTRFDRRTLFATRDKSPVWLLALAYSIAFGVWGTILYLVGQVMKMRKLGLQAKDIPLTS
jgi:hypothetical protein